MAKSGTGKSVTPLLTGFAGLIKKYNMYPTGHPTINMAFQQLRVLFNEYFETHPTLVFGVGRDRIYIESEELTGDEWIQGLTDSLHSHSVSRLIFHRGVNQHDLEIFLQTLHMDPLVTRSAGGYKALLSKRGVTGIEVDEIDYKLEDDEINLQLEALSDAEIWKRLAHGWTRTELDENKEEIEFIKILLENAPRLSLLLDSVIAATARPDESSKAADVFFQILGLMMPDSVEDGQDAKAHFQNQVEKVLHIISPKSRYVMMQKTIQDEKIERPILDFVKEILNNLSDRDFSRGLFEGLNPQNATLNNFCNTYLSFVSTYREKAVLSEIDGVIRDRDIRNDNQFASMVNRVKSLPEDDRRLVHLSLTFSQAYVEHQVHNDPIYEFVESNSSDISEIIRDVTEIKVENAAYKNLFSVLDLLSGRENFTFFAHGLEDEILTLIRTGRYNLAARAVKVLRRYASSKNEHEVSRQMSRKILYYLKKPELADELLRALSEWGKKESKALTLLISSMGSQAHGPTLIAMCAEKNRAVRAIMFDILTNAGDKIIPRCRQLLDDPNWFVVRNMITLLTKLQPEDLIEDLSKTASHSDVRVRKETARALATVEHSKAPLILFRLAKDRDPGVVRQAILDLGKFRGSEEVTEFLCNALSEKNPFNGDEKSELLTIVSLSKARCHSALPTLVRYITGKGFWSNKPDKMIEAVVKAISALDTHSAHEVLEKGTKSWNKTIRQACRCAIQDDKGWNS